MVNLEPLLSVVVVSRNDDHGGNLMRRMQLFVTGWLEQAKKHNLNSELIIVEWNPLPNRPRLAEALKWPLDTGPCIIRIIQVPPEVHQRFKYADKLPVFQMIGKNVGIRRARGRFILATNIDILFSNEIIEFFTSGHLEAKHMYRVDRYDVPSEIPNAPIDKQLDYCRENVIRINNRNRTVILKELPSTDEWKSSKPLSEQKKSRIPGESLLRAFYTRLCSIHNIRDSFILTRDVFIALPKVISNGIRLLYHLVTTISIRPIIYGKPLHTNACGDFTLMARNHWLALRGYAEFEIFSMHLDGLTCVAAHYGGIKETILKEPMRIYHIEHALGSGFSPGIGVKLMNERLEKAGIRQLSYEEFSNYLRKIRWHLRSNVFNDNINWGLADEDLPETIMQTKS